MTKSHTADHGELTRLIERQMRNWELGRSQREMDPAAPGQVVQDFVSISRQEGTPGSEVATVLARALNWPLFDREILKAMSGDDEMRERIYASMDERDMNWWEEALRAFAQPELGRNDYFRRLTETVLSLARQGSAVFLGRAADLILPRTTGLRVRLVAPLDMRIQSYARVHGLSQAQARTEIETVEAERRAFVHKHFGVDVADPVRSDLVINTGYFSHLQAVEMILAARHTRLH